MSAPRPDTARVEAEASPSQRADVDRLARAADAVRREGNLERAEPMFLDVLGRFPEHAWTLAHYGELLLQKGAYDDALHRFTQSLALDAKSAWAWAHRAGVLDRLDRVDEALLDLNRALAIDAAYPWALAMRVRVYVRKQCFEAALNDLDAVAALDPKVIPDLDAERGLIRTAVGRYDEAEPYFERALAARPEDHFAAYNAAIHQWLYRGPVAAQPALVRARRILEPLAQAKVSAAVYELGGLAALEGDIEQALAHLGLAVALERGQSLLTPSHKRIHYDLAWRSWVDDPRLLAIAGAM